MEDVRYDGRRKWRGCWRKGKGGGEALVTVTMTKSHQKPVSTRPLSAMGTVVDPCILWHNNPLHTLTTRPAA